MPRKPMVPIVGRDPVSQLYRAVQRYVKANGGALIVVGGVTLQQWPTEPQHAIAAVKAALRKAGAL